MSSIKKKTTGIFIVLLLLVLLVFAFLYDRQYTEPEPISKTDYMLNTVVSVTIYDSQDESLLDGALDICQKYEDLVSPTLKTSEIYRLNHGELPEEDGYYQLSSETADLIAKGLEYCRLSDGAFDIAIEPVSSLWDFTSGEDIVPSQEENQAALPLVN